MADEKDLLNERGRSLEDEYFRRKDRELLERAREQEAAALRRRQLAEALGTSDEATVTTAAALGFDPVTVALLEIVPPLQVAWADGTLPPKERTAIERLLARPGLQAAAQAGTRLIADWMSREPGADLYQLAIDTLRRRVPQAPAEGAQFVDRIIADCNAVAGASGGVLGLGARSSAEAERIRQIAAALGRPSDSPG